MKGAGVRYRALRPFRLWLQRDSGTYTSGPHWDPGRGTSCLAAPLGPAPLRLASSYP
jgi:hypothetical protein